MDNLYTVSTKKGILKTLKYDLREWIEWFVSGWPETFFGKKLRVYYWSKKFNLVERPTFIGKSSKLYGDKNKITVGRNFLCGDHVIIDAAKSHGVYIGDDVSIAHGAYVRSSNHKFDRLDIPISQQGHRAEKIMYDDIEYSVVIEDDVWIGANVIILSGAKISTGSIAAAGSVISKEFPPYSVIAGNPARIVMSRKEYESSPML